MYVCKQLPFSYIFIHKSTYTRFNFSHFINLLYLIRLISIWFLHIKTVVFRYLQKKSRTSLDNSFELLLWILSLWGICFRLYMYSHGPSGTLGASGGSAFLIFKYFVLFLLTAIISLHPCRRQSSPQHDAATNMLPLCITHCLLPHIALFMLTKDDWTKAYWMLFYNQCIVLIR